MRSNSDNYGTYAAAGACPQVPSITFFELVFKSVLKGSGVRTEFAATEFAVQVECFPDDANCIVGPEQVFDHNLLVLEHFVVLKEPLDLAHDVRGKLRLVSVVGERGITLSGGQKQRTAIARAVMRDPRILILDDSLSAVDTYTEEKILHNLRDVRADRTTLIVSHRVSTIRDADLICVLDHGRIIERGTHDELLDLNGEYAELYERQLLEEELEAAD